MNRKTSTLLSVGISAVLIAGGIWLLCNHTTGIWAGHGDRAMGFHGMMGSGGMGIPMILFWLILIAALVLIISGSITGIRTSKQNRDNPPTALEILKQRYAQGEIDQDEYHTRLKDLHS